MQRKSITFTTTNIKIAYTQNQHYQTITKLTILKMIF